MPLYMDRHNAAEITLRELEEAHRKDLEIQDKHEVAFLTYWFDPNQDCVCCLAEAPNEEALLKVHQEAHGNMPHHIIEVDLNEVEVFLGRTTDPISEDGKASPPVDGSFRHILFTDMQGSTTLSTSLGDSAAIALLDSHDRIIRASLKRHQGVEVKHTGDGFMTSFVTGEAAVNCAADILRSFDQFNKESQTPIHVRVGINAGLPVERGNDLFGITVQLAARVCDFADPKQALVTGIVYELVKDKKALRVDMKKTERAHFKGFDHAIQLYEIDWHD